MCPFSNFSDLFSPRHEKLTIFNDRTLFCVAAWKQPSLQTLPTADYLLFTGKFPSATQVNWKNTTKNN